MRSRGSSPSFRSSVKARINFSSLVPKKSLIKSFWFIGVLMDKKAGSRGSRVKGLMEEIRTTFRILLAWECQVMLFSVLHVSSRSPLLMLSI